MLKIHTSDGRTIRIDLRDPAQAREWLPRLEQDAFQASISGVSVVETHDVRTRCAACGGKGSGQVGVQYSISRPQGLTGVTYEAERVSNNGRSGDRVTVFAGDVRLSLMAHESQPSARIQLAALRPEAPQRVESPTTEADVSETTKMDVIVHKAINLMTGETLQDFTSALATAAREHVKQKLNLPGPRPGKSYPGWSCYVAEIFSASVVVSLYKDDMAGGNKYYAFSFDRDAKTKKFTFGDTTEVERFTGFRAKPATTMSTTKRQASVRGDSAWAAPEAPSEDVEKAAVQKAPKTSASINDLPDAAFAVISAGGKKDANGKTVPRSLRHLPHHTSAVKDPAENTSLDLPHLRNALARVGQTNLNPADMAKARAHLQRHAKAALASRGGKPSVAKSDTDEALIADMDRLIERASVAKSADGALWVRKGTDFWASLSL